eukprot:39720-Amphidinium_carterae.1
MERQLKSTTHSLDQLAVTLSPCCIRNHLRRRTCKVYTTKLSLVKWSRIVQQPLRVCCNYSNLVSFQRTSASVV